VPLKVSEIIKVIETDGWYLGATRGSHRQYKHPDKGRAGHCRGQAKQHIAPRTERSILRQAQIERRSR
jgi:predicted RNA binding protein YcfA (HicA-like mRNA interferase family)